MAEALGARATFAFINRYLRYMEPEILRAGGFINDIAGDGIMALIPDPDRAIDAALGMLDALKRFNADLHGSANVRMGIGVNSGPLMLGTIGGGEQLSCNVIGDTVNLASRVEGMTKMYGAQLLITDLTRDRLKSPQRLTLREIDIVKAKGKREPVTILEVLDGDSANRAQKRATLERFTRGLERYRAGDFEAARKLFERCHQRAPGDVAAGLYVERCERFLRRGVPSGWSGITQLDKK